MLSIPIEPAMLSLVMMTAVVLSILWHINDRKTGKPIAQEHIRFLVCVEVE